MVIISPRILSRAFEGLHAGSKLFICGFRNISGKVKVPNLFVSLFEGVSHSNLATDGAGTVSLYVK
jgi:hypothetical protein